MAISYNVYANTGRGDPINYGQPVATTAALSITSGTLTYPGSWSFGIRAQNANGEEQNLDCEVTILFDAAGNDVTNVPAAPLALAAVALAGAQVRVTWGYPPVTTAPDGFHVYLGEGTPDYGTPVATVAYKGGRGGVWSVSLAGLADATTYVIGVRAFQGQSEEENTATASVTADATGPTAVHDLAGTTSS